MGKSKSKSKKKNRRAAASAGHSALQQPERPAHVAAAAASGAATQYPLPFPHSSSLSLPPKGRFLRSNGNYKKSYKKALETSYEGFVCDDPDAKTADGNEEIFPHHKIRRALQTMEKANLFRTDVTQPFGLGTKCAKTYVTRCLLGEEGTTYKYLGLRMFSHPWNASDTSDDNLADALKTISQLNDILTDRTETHLSALGEERKSRGVPQPTIRGRAKFDITLINRMETSEELKAEPMTGEGRCTVSWHADSSLENYSTIGVYHTLFENERDRGEPDKNGWSVALRVAHDSEGPTASRRGTDISAETDIPVVSTSLPSGAAYYMLDDFNHHHQHAVLAPDSPSGFGGVRFSSTHRLLRLGHNVNFVIERCRSTVAGFHRKGPKVWRSEQLLLSDTENEWIRQFYIQGAGHKANLWPYWKGPMCTLLKYWSQLETRTKQVVDVLRFAAEERCGIGFSNNSTSDSVVPSRAERKLREKRKKAATAISDIMDRSEDLTDDAHDAIYVPIAILLEERATMRDLWTERGRDKVFTRLDYEYRPLPPPFAFGSNDQTSTCEEIGQSPLAGKPDDLRLLASNLRKWGQAYRSQSPSDLPNHSPAQSLNVNSAETNHAKSLSWEGWASDKLFGLEMQMPWAGALLSGKKKVETRAYDLPPALVGKKIFILESKPGKAGVSALGNVISDADGIDNFVIVKGWAIFDRVIEYRKKDDFERDEELHLVTANSGYGWENGKTEVIFGWVCKEIEVFGADSDSASTDIPIVGALVRRMRSLYQLQPKRAERGSGKGNSEQKSGFKKKKKKRKKPSTDNNISSTSSAEKPRGGFGTKKKKRRRF